MSGIVGIYYLDGRLVEPSEIQGMLNTISHRGPDGSGIWTEGSIGLGHQMLHTTPESIIGMNSFMPSILMAGLVKPFRTVKSS